jgi:hypothetical protein
VKWVECKVIGNFGNFSGDNAAKSFYWKYLQRKAVTQAFYENCQVQLARQLQKFEDFSADENRYENMEKYEGISTGFKELL